MQHYQAPRSWGGIFVKAILTALIVLFSVASFADQTNHGSGGSSAAPAPVKSKRSMKEAAFQPTTPPGSAALEAVRARISRMMKIVEGDTLPQSEMPPAGAKFLIPRTQLAAQIVQEIKASYDKGELRKSLAEFFTGYELFADAEPKEVFTVDGKDLLETLDAKESLIAAEEYTLSRKRLREKLFKEVALLLSRDTDPRSLLVAEAVKKAIPDSQNSYDEAIKVIKAEYASGKKPRPICFTCGELESADYGFFEAMGNTAERVIKETALNLKWPDSKALPRPYFEPGRRFYTYNGQSIRDLTTGEEHQVYVENNTYKYRDPKGTVANILTTVPLQKTLFDLNLEFKNKGKTPQVLPQIGSPALASLGTVKTDPNKPADPPDLTTWYQLVRHSASGGMAELAPRAEDLALELGLMIQGESVLLHKNMHWGEEYEMDEKGQPKLDEKGEKILVDAKDKNGNPIKNEKGENVKAKSTEFGVHIRWDLIDKASPEEQKRILTMLAAVQRGDIKDFRYDNGNEGYCLWCNLVNDPVSKKRIEEFKKK